jgi:hypothetical protein
MVSQLAHNIPRWLKSFINQNWWPKASWQEINSRHMLHLRNAVLILLISLAADAMFTSIFRWNYNLVLLRLLLGHCFINCGTHSHVNYGNMFLESRWRIFTFGFLPELCAKCVSILPHFFFHASKKKCPCQNENLYLPTSTNQYRKCHCPPPPFNFVQNVWWNLFRTRFHFYIQNYYHRKLCPR